MFIFSNLAISVDGKIATASRVHFPLGTKEDLKQMMVLRRESNAILMGASTLRAYRKPLFVSQVEKQPLNVVLSSNLEGISPDWPFFTDQRIQRLLLVGDKAAPGKFEPFRSSCDIAVMKSGAAPMARQIVAELEKRGVSRLLVEGGGGVMWDFASEDLIDEYHVTMTPRILGGTAAPTLVDGKGFEPAGVVNLKLEQCRVVGDELYLVYRKTGRRGP